ncbi:SMI1/KNR4 family protein [Siphonobacter sp. BAB-5385]|uniref:SMI1/KNR4 family protein n=1 Tax=Siphonobacter sp. BAB-5385 TaxID=1864822 RepID=UPI0034E9541B
MYYSEKAHEQELIACGSYFDFKLPIDLVAFLRKYNGATFYEFEDTGGYRFLSCQELVDENRFQQENFGDDWDEHMLLFC